MEPYWVVFEKTYGPFPHNCYFCGFIVEGYRMPRNRDAAVVHHLDCNRSNNSADNLVPSHHSCHSKYHMTLIHASRTEAQRSAIAKLAADNLWSQKTPEERRQHLAKAHAASSQHPNWGKNRQGFAPWNKGKKTGPLSDETRARMSAAHIGKSFSDEHRKRLSTAAKAREAKRRLQ